MTLIPVRSSWTIEQGWSRPLGTPRPAVAPYQAIPLHVSVRHVRRAEPPMTAAHDTLARLMSDRAARRATQRKNRSKP